jgi:acyl-coenzyme A synthetase/AMP-(fatty) acid ligase/rubrerythrin
MLCPKCHRPLVDEDDGPYICCADAPMQWQCGACGKVSEGFAFPYGRCPQCGGELALRTPEVAHAHAESLTAVRMAFEIELGGRAFYQRAAADSSDETLRALFGRFAVMEGEHMETLSRRYHVEPPDVSDNFRVELAAIFADVESRPQDPANLFRIAIALEKRAADFFISRVTKVTPGSAEALLYKELAAEEREHAAILATEYARWQEGKAGLFSGDSLVDAARATRDPGGALQALNGAAVLLEGHEPARIALVCGDQQISYAELRDRVARAAAVWRARGLVPGDRVAIKLCDGIDWVVAFLGTIWAGGVAVAVNPHIPAPEWRYILDEAGFNVIVAENADDTPEPWKQRVILVEEGRRAVAAAEPIPPRLVDEDTPAFWVHSSGTSGKPKAVVHAHRFARDIERISRERVGITQEDRLFASSRLFFSYPQTNSLYAGLKIGATVILDPRWPTAETVAETVAAMRPTVLFCVPSLYRNLLHSGLAPKLAADGVRLCVSAGEPLPASLRAAWREATGIGMVDGYGASETLVLVLTALDGDDGLQPSPGVEVQAVDPASAAAGIPTRLCFRVACVSLGYLDRPAAQADSFRDGAFCPADLFVPTDGGGWRFAGREDSLVKIKGRWVNLVELEERLAAGTPGLIEAAAVILPDEDGVDAIAFFFVARTGDAEAVEAALRERAQAQQHYQRPKWLHAVDALPRTATGKLLRRKLSELIRPAG